MKKKSLANGSKSLPDLASCPEKIGVYPILTFHSQWEDWSSMCCAQHCHIVGIFTPSTTDRSLMQRAGSLPKASYSMVMADVRFGLGQRFRSKVLQHYQTRLCCPQNISLIWFTATLVIKAKGKLSLFLKKSQWSLLRTMGIFAQSLHAAYGMEHTPWIVPHLESAFSAHHLMYSLTPFSPPFPLKQRAAHLLHFIPTTSPMRQKVWLTHPKIVENRILRRPHLPLDHKPSQPGW